MNYPSGDLRNEEYTLIDNATARLKSGITISIETGRLKGIDMRNWADEDEPRNIDYPHYFHGDYPQDSYHYSDDLYARGGSLSGFDERDYRLPARVKGAVKGTDRGYGKYCSSSEDEVDENDDHDIYGPDLEGEPEQFDDEFDDLGDEPIDAVVAQFKRANTTKFAPLDETSGAAEDATTDSAVAASGDVVITIPPAGGEMGDTAAKL